MLSCGFSGMVAWSTAPALPPPLVRCVALCPAYYRCNAALLYDTKAGTYLVVFALLVFLACPGWVSLDDATRTVHHGRCEEEGYTQRTKSPG
jgi:hypothetical protein